jgi:hypothetical protein
MSSDFYSVSYHCYITAILRETHIELHKFSEETAQRKNLVHYVKYRSH